MRYAPILETDFDTRYQLLADYLKANEDKTLPEIEYGLNHLPSGHALKNKNLFVLSRDNRKSFLHKAAIEGNLLLITFLQKTGHDINLRDAQHKTPLYDACDQLKLQSVDALLGYAADPNLGNGHLTVKVSVEGVEEEFTGKTIPLVAAIKSEATVTAAELSTATGEDFSQLTIEQATEQAAAKIVKKLIASNADVNFQFGLENFSSLHLAIIYLKPLIVKEIADSGTADFRLVDLDGQAALHMVVDYRDGDEKQNAQVQMQKEKQITELIIPHLEALNIQDKNGNTPLQTAVICSNVDVVRAIYKNDYKFFKDVKILSMQNNEGNTAIHEAVKEAWRGPKILAFLLSVATADDLAIVNKAGETARQIADRLLIEVNTVQDLVKKVNEATNALEGILDTPLTNVVEANRLVKIEELIKEINSFRSNGLYDAKVSNALSLEVDDLAIELENYKLNPTNSLQSGRVLIERLRQLDVDAKEQFFHETYLESLKSVKQEKYFAWKAEQLRLPSSFPNLETVDSHLLNSPVPMESIYHRAEAWYVDGQNKYRYGAYQQAITSLEESTRLYNSNPRYSKHRSLADAYVLLGNAYHAENSNDNAEINLEAGIEIYHPLKEYQRLEYAYQSLAKTYIPAGELSIANYEEANRRKTRSSNNQEKLSGHLALAGLYKELKEQILAPNSYSSNAILSNTFSKENLQAHESFHFHQAYKLTQGNLDNSAHVVLQREIGIANDANLGTYNIQQCVAVVACGDVYDPATQTMFKKVVLSHFDKASGPASFIEQLLNEFPGQAKVDLYISGGRDRVTWASTMIPSKVSDNNIEQVLKQIHLKNVEDSVDGNPENGRFTIRACDVGDNPSPVAIVFDVQSQRLVHAMPNRADSSLESRSVNFLLQENKKQNIEVDYLRPLNPVDFTKSETERTVIFSTQEQRAVRDKTFEYINYYANKADMETWKHDQLFYPLMKVGNEIAGVTHPDFTHGLLTERLNSIRSQYLGAPLAKVSIHQAEDDLFNDDNIAGEDEVFIRLLRCFGNRSRRDAGLCELDSEHLLEDLRKLPEVLQSEALEHVATRRVGGTKQKEIATLVHHQKIIKYLQRVGGISSGLMEGVFNLDALADWMKGDPFLAIQLAGFKGLNQVLEKAAAKMDAQGLKWLAEGKILSGKLLRGTTPVLRRVGTSLFNAVDFYEEFKAFKNNTNNTDALVGMISDGVQLGVDVGAGGVEVLEISSETFAAMGFSEVTGPLGEAIVGVVMLGDKIYKTIEQVDLEEHLLHLSELKKWMEGVRLFFGFRSAFQKQMDEITQYVQILTKQLDFLKNHPEIKHIIIPGIVKTGDKEVCHRTRTFQKGCTTSYIPLFSTIETSSVNVADKLIGFKLTDEEIASPAGSELLCVPTGIGKALPEEGAYACDGSIGLTNSNSTGNIAFFNGINYAMGFREKINIFRITDGPSASTGGNKDDIFNIDAKAVFTGVNNQGGLDGLDGGNGSDSLMLQGFRPEAVERIEVNLDAGYIKYANKTLQITRIEKLFGGTFPLAVTAGCDSEVIDTGGAPTLNNSDTLLIPNNASCHYNLKMHLKPNIQVTNQAEVGNFTYYILPGKGEVTVNLTAMDKGSNTQGLNHQFVFNAPISDVSTIAYSAKSADNQAQATKLQVNLINRSNDTLVGDFKFALHSNLLDNPSLHFIGNVEEAETNAELRIGNNHLYLIQHNLNNNVSAIMQQYALKAKEWNCICLLSTENGEQIVIGHQGKIVMNNNPDVRTHLHGNGGEGLFVIKSGMPSLWQSRLPISEVVLYRRPEDRHIDSLDFRSLTAQVQAETNATAKILFVTPNRYNNLGHDLLILFGMVTPSTPAGKIIEIINVRLKDAVLNHWYKKYLHIIFDVKAPQQIVGRHSHLRLKPIAREIDPQHQGFAIIGVQDVEPGTDLIVSQAYQAGAFFQQNQTNLLWTNTFSNSSNPITPFTLLLANFYIESKLQTLFLQFTNRKIALKNNSIAIATAKDFDEASNNLEACLRAESSAIMNSTQLVSHFLSQTANASVEINQDQEHYSGNEINATSIEDDHIEDYLYKRRNNTDFPEANLTRQLRSTEHLNGHSTNNAGARQSGILQTTVNMLSSIFNNPGKQRNFDKIANVSPQFQGSLSGFAGVNSFKSQSSIGLNSQESPKAAQSSLPINYDGTFYGNACLGKWITSLFAPAAIKQMHNREQVLSQSEKTSDLKWAFKNLQDGIKKYGRG